MNLDGRICAESLLTFGVMGMLIVYAVSPNIDINIEKISRKLTYILIVMLIGLFSFDVFTSIKNPNTGDGVATDITKGEWPTTFWKPDHLNINGIEVYNMQEAIKAEASTSN